MNHDDMPMTQSEWMAEDERIYVFHEGARNPDRAWILSDRDVWYPNPHYNGPAVPHPESDIDETDS